MFNFKKYTLIYTVPLVYALSAGSIFTLTKTTLMAHGGGHHGGGHHHSHHGGHGHHHGHNGHHHGHHHWHHAHHNDWWHHGAHPGWEHNHYSHWNSWHHPLHNWYWYGAGAAGVAGLGLAGYEAANPGYYYDPNFYYQENGVPSIEYEYDEPNNQPPSSGSTKTPSTQPSAQPVQPAKSSSSQTSIEINQNVSLDSPKSVPTKPDTKNPAANALIDDEKDFEDVDQDDEDDDDEDDDDDDGDEKKMGITKNSLKKL